MIRASAVATTCVSSSEVAPAKTIRPSCDAIAPSGTISTMPWAVPLRGAGPAHVMSCLA
jgi:hypothetical protein